jgi:hypothetical protein
MLEASQTVNLSKLLLPNSTDAQLSWKSGESLTFNSPMISSPQLHLYYLEWQKVFNPYVICLSMPATVSPLYSFWLGYVFGSVTWCLPPCFVHESCEPHLGSHYHVLNYRGCKLRI